MKLTRSFLAIALVYSLGFISFTTLAVQPVNAQETRVALQRGYRTGYSDGYMAGYRDSIDNLAKQAVKHKEYVNADRAFNKEYGTIDDYRDGYRQGFETGYNTGFEKRSFDSAVPSSLARRGVTDITAPAEASVPEPAAAVTETETVKPPVTEPVTQAEQTSVAENPPIAASENQAAAVEPAANGGGIIRQASYTNTDDPIIIIPRDTELIIELQEDIGTASNRDGDRFTAKIVGPVEIAGATVEGRISRIQKPGRIKRRSQMELSFDRIVLTEQRWSNFGAVLTEVMPIKGDNVKLVDNEGTAIGKSSYKADAVKIGAATGTGLGIGALTGGPVGAAVGAGVGAAFGVGAVVIERGKHIRLNRNQQLKIKAAYETKIR
jgi:hypothetical protein